MEPTDDFVDARGLSKQIAVVLATEKIVGCAQVRVAREDQPAQPREEPSTRIAVESAAIGHEARHQPEFRASAKHGFELGVECRFASGKRNASGAVFLQ